MKRKYAIGIGVLVVLLCLVLTMCGIKNWLQRPDKDELKDSDYITGTSDKFDDIVEDSGEEEKSDESHVDKNAPVDDSDDGNERY